MTIDQPLPRYHNRRISIIYMPIECVACSPKSFRKHSPRQIRAVMKGLEKFGFVASILIDQNNHIIQGHALVEAAKRLGYQEVPVVRIEDLTDLEARALSLFLDKISEHANWDRKSIGEFFIEALAIDPEFDLTLTGFSTTEIDLHIEEVSLSSVETEEGAGQLPTGPATTQLGDLWLLETHRVLCANALEPASFERLMNGSQARQILTDPPFNKKIAGNVSGHGRIQHRDFAMAVGELSETEFIGFLKTCLGLSAKHSSDGALAYVFMDYEHAYELLVAGRAVFTELKNLCVWCKTNAGTAPMYRPQHELIFVFKNGTARHQDNVGLGELRYRTNVWTCAGMNSFEGRATDEGNLLHVHPTSKPVKLLADAILDCTSRRDIVCDPFLGSGSTLIAAQRTGRHCYGMELDPVYVDAVIRRWEAFTGGVAVHADTQMSFREVAESRKTQAVVDSGEASHD